MSEFRLNQETVNSDTAVLNVGGFLDAHTFEKLESHISGLFKNGIYKVVVDLSQVEYISSAGAGVFIGALSEAQENGGNIVLLNPSANVMEVFDLLGLSQIFNVARDKNTALTIF